MGGMEQDRPTAIVHLYHPDATFDVHVHDLTTEQIASIFPSGVDRRQRYAIGDDRIIQRYLEVYEYEVLFALVNVPGYDRFRPHRFIMMCHPYYRDKMKDLIDHQFENRIGSVLTGHVEINAESVHNYLLKELGKLGKKTDDPFSIMDADALWKRQSPDMRAVIQQWMRKGVFRPERPAPHRDKIGSRLSMPDLVTTGLIFGLLRRGAQRDDFAETYEAGIRLEPETE
jgi:hypothetical protein